MAGRLDFEKIKAEALRRARDLCEAWFPLGGVDRNGLEYRVGDLSGSPSRKGKGAGSLAINLRTGVWCDWADDVHRGGDLISLYAAIHHLEQGKAAEELAEMFWGTADVAREPKVGDGRPRKPPAGTAEPRASAEPPDEWKPIVPPPAGQKPPIGHGHEKLGAPTRVWIYRGETGDPLFAVCRWDMAGGKKTILPLTYGRLDGELGWHWKHADEPMPIYGLDELARAPKARPVLVVEGEKAVDGARALMPEDGDGDAYVVVSWPRGGATADKTDWSPLAGRNVLLWPDADAQVYGSRHPKAGELKAAVEQPGVRAMLKIADILEAQECTVSMVVPPGKPYGDSECEPGWDLADAKAEGWSPGDMARYIDDFELGLAAFRDRFPEPEPEAPPPAEDGGSGSGGGDAGKDKYAHRKETLPIIPLGKLGRTFYFLTRLGELLDIRASEMGEAGLDLLFDGRLDWMMEHFPLIDSDGMARPNSVNYRRVRGWLMRECANKGLFDPGTPIRGVGVWKDGQGDILVHAGDGLSLIDGEGKRVWVSAGRQIDNVLYPAKPPVERPGPKQAGREAGLKLQAAIDLWNFERMAGESAEGRPIGADVVLGYIGAAMLGGAPYWRSHVYVTARRGSGKTTLAELVEIVMGAGAHPMANNFTEAGLRQAMTGEARALILDEAEAEEGENWRLKAVIELISHMSSRNGARAVRGQPGGAAQTFDVTGSAYMSSILQGPLRPQDRSRITNVRLASLPQGRDPAGLSQRVDEAKVEMRRLSPRLRARAIANWPRFRDTFDVYRDAFLGAGCGPREAEQFATFAAGRDVLVADHVPDADTLEEEIDRWRPLIMDALQDDEDSNEGQECWTRLLTTPAGMWQAGDQRTIGELIAAARLGSGSMERKSLQRLGLRMLKWGEGSGDALAVANNHEGLSRVFDGSRWARRVWREALMYLGSDVAAHSTTVRFAGAITRCIAIPGKYLPVVDEAMQSEDAGEEVTVTGDVTPERYGESPDNPMS